MYVVSETAVTTRDSGKKLKLHGTCNTVRYIIHSGIFEENSPIAIVLSVFVEVILGYRLDSQHFS